MKWNSVGILLLSAALVACGKSGPSSSPLSDQPSTASPGSPGFPGDGPVSGGADCTDTRADSASKAIIEKVCLLVNQERNSAGQKALRLDAALSEVAQAHAEDMVQRNYFSHNTPEGLSPSDRMQAAGIRWGTWGENIAYYYKTPEEVMQSWMNSPGHKANILKSDYGKIGIGYFQNYWVQDFTD